MPWSEHSYYVAMAFKMSEGEEQWICINFCIDLEYSSMETIQMIQKATPMGNWWLAASSWQHAHWCITACEKFFEIYQINQVTQPPYSPDLVPCDFWLFPKLKSPLKGKKIQTMNEIQKNMTGQMMTIGKTVWDPREPTLKGTEAIVLCTMFLVSSLITASIFHITWLDTFWRYIYIYSFVLLLHFVS